MYNKDGEKMHTICPNCMTTSGLQFDSRMSTVGGMHVCIDDETTYRIVDGVSPQGVLVTANLVKEEEKAIIISKEDKIVDDKQIAEGLKELGLTTQEIEGYYDAVGDEYDDWDDIDDYEEVIDLREYDDDSSDGGNKNE